MNAAIRTSLLLPLMLWSLSVGAMAQNQAQPAGPKVIRQGTHGDWEHSCIVQPSGAQECFISQFSVSKQANVRGLMTIVKDGKGYGVRFEVPIGVYLPTGLALTIDGKDFGTTLFERCFPDRCVAFVDLRQETVAMLKKGKVATLIVHSAPKQPIYLPISLKGVTAGFRALG